MGDPDRTLEPTADGLTAALNGPFAPLSPEVEAPETLSRSATFVLLPSVIGGGGPNLTGPGDLCPWRTGLELGTMLAPLLLPAIPSRSLSRRESLINEGLCSGGGLRGEDSAEPSLWPVLANEGKEGGGTAEGVDGPAVGGTLRPVLENLCPGDLRCPSYPDGTRNSMMNIK